MNKGKCLLLLNILGMLSISVPIVAADSPDAREVLRRFTEARKNFTSFIVEYESKNMSNSPQRNRSAESYSKAEYRSDGIRNRRRTSYWGNVDIHTNHISKDQARYNSSLWDGENLYSYTRNAGDPGFVILSRKKDPGGVPKKQANFIKSGSIPGQIMGYPAGHYGKRIDEILLDSRKHLELRQEKLKGVDCYIIDAIVTKQGKFSVWIDPTHDYHIVKMHIQKKPGDYNDNWLLRKGDYVNVTDEVLRFQQIGDSWFPLKCKGKRLSCFDGSMGTKGIVSKNEWVINVTNVVLNPDHDALKSFIPNDIPNGAVVKFAALPPSLEFVWQDGEVVDANGREVDVDKLIKAESEKVKKPKPKGK